MTNVAWRKHLRDLPHIFSQGTALLKTADIIRSIFLSPAMTYARYTYVISTTCLTLVFCLKPTLEWPAGQLHSTLLSIQTRVVTQLSALASEAWLALVAEDREPGGPDCHFVASGDLLTPLTSEQTLLLEPNLLPCALGAQTHNLGEVTKPDPGSGLQTKVSSGLQGKTAIPVRTNKTPCPP